MEENILDPLGLTNTRAYYPLELRGDQLAIGYAGMGRSGIRPPLEPFNTGAITPAAGFTSSVSDLGKFASWQFRLLENGGEEVLNAHTLREMYRINWVDPDLKATSGLGFDVNQLAGMATVGHGGDCPGYISNITMIPQQKLASVVLMNAGDAPAGRASQSVLKVISAALKVAKKPSEEAMPDYSMYEGNYHSLYSGYGGEQAIRQWGNQLVSITIPSDDLGNAMTRLDRDSGHKFLSLKENEKPQGSWIFEMAEDGKAVRIFQDDTYWHRIEETTATSGGDVVV
jgi:CubicO group peptidase (beta-lactamase class C family)